MNTPDNPREASPGAPLSPAPEAPPRPARNTGDGIVSVSDFLRMNGYGKRVRSRRKPSSGPRPWGWWA